MGAGAAGRRGRNLVRGLPRARPHLQTILLPGVVGGRRESGGTWLMIGGRPAEEELKEGGGDGHDELGLRLRLRANAILGGASASIRDRTQWANYTHPFLFRAPTPQYAVTPPMQRCTAPAPLHSPRS